MTDSEKIQLLGEKQGELFIMFSNLADIVQGINERLERVEHMKRRDNEVTYLHNEVNEIKKVLGLDGSVPTKKVNKYKRYEG